MRKTTHLIAKNVEIVVTGKKVRYRTYEKYIKTEI